MESLVGALRTAFPGKHTGWVLGRALEWEHSCSIGEFTRHILPQVPLKYIAPGLVPGQGDFRDLQV